MTRLAADQLREMANAAKKAEKLAEKKRSIEAVQEAKKAAFARERETCIWQSLYLAAINGETRCNIKNLKDDGVNYLKKFGFSTTEIFVRTQNRIKYLNRVELLKSKIEVSDKKIKELEDSIDDYKERSNSIDITPLEYWIYENQSIAFACDLEIWFGNDLDYVSVHDLEDLDSLNEFVKEKIDKFKDKERVKTLKQLLRAINVVRGSVDLSFDLNKSESAIEELGDAIRSYEYEIAGLEEDFGFIHDNDVTRLHEVDWKYLGLTNQKNTDFEYTVDALRWFSSSHGQTAFKLFDNDVLSLSQRGIRRLELRSIDYAGQIYLVNDNGKFNGKFPSTFDFLEAMRLLKFKVIGLKNNKITLNCSVVW